MTTDLHSRMLATMSETMRIHFKSLHSRIDELEKRLEEADLEDMADRLEIVEDADADGRLWQVESDLEEVESKLDEHIEEKSHD